MSLWKLINGRWGSGAGETDEIRIDAATNTLQSITYSHHEVHSGSAYVIHSYVDLTINNVFDIQITTPNTTKWAHMTFKFECENETNWWVYENVNIITPGTAITPGNRNRNSANVSGLIFKGITNANIAAANADTAIVGALQLANGVIGSGRQSGGRDHSEEEVVLRQNRDYTVRFEALTAGYTNYHLDWYEHVDKHPLNNPVTTTSTSTTVTTTTSTTTEAPTTTTSTTAAP